MTSKQQQTIQAASTSLLVITALLIFITSIVRLGTSLYLPALPIIGKDLNIEEAMLGLSLTTYFIGFSIFTLVAGPLSDALGRRRVLLTGCFIFIIGSSICGLCEGGYSLLMGRFLQAIGACCIPVSGRAVVRDVFDDQQVISVLGWMAALGAIVPAFAPTLGGVITEHLGWRYNFIFLAVFSLIVLIVSLKYLPETASSQKDYSLKLSYIFSSFVEMLKDKAFMLSILPIICCFAIQGIYFACAPFVFINELHLTPTEFGLTNLVLVASLVSGRVLCSLFNKKVGLAKSFLICGLMSLVSGIGFIYLCYATHINLYIVLIPAIFFGLAFGTMVPIGLKEALGLYKHKAGTASAIYGCLTLGASGLLSALAGFGMDLEINPIYVMSVLASCCCVMIFIFTYSLFKKG